MDLNKTALITAVVSDLTGFSLALAKERPFNHHYDRSEAPALETAERHVGQRQGCGYGAHFILDEVESLAPVPWSILISGYPD